PERICVTQIPYFGTNDDFCRKRLVSVVMSSQARQIIRGLASAVGLVILFYSVDASDAQMKAFFPKRPAGVTVSHLRGVLVDYGIGNASGGFTVVDGNGKRVDFYTAWPMYIDGRPV